MQIANYADDIEYIVYWIQIANYADDIEYIVYWINGTVK